MIYQIRLIIYKRKYIYDDLIVSSASICKYNKEFNGDDHQKNINDNIKKEKKLYPIKLNKKGLNAYLVSAYIHTMNCSNTYRKSAFNLLLQFIKNKIVKLDCIESVICIRLRTPKYQILDYDWCKRLNQTVMERLEIDNAMSWLSTLGGAFSALGDQYNHCAKIAGKISVQQFKLAMKLGDPELIFRCKLYAALSLLQQGYLKVSRQLVKEIFEFAVTIKDVKLQKMCQGVWAKLKYCYSQKKHNITYTKRYTEK